MESLSQTHILRSEALHLDVAFERKRLAAALPAPSMCRCRSRTRRALSARLGMGQTRLKSIRSKIVAFVVGLPTLAAAVLMKAGLTFPNLRRLALKLGDARSVRWKSSPSHSVFAE
eukprot:1891575-Amphidinium_carterae.2